MATIKDIAKLAGVSHGTVSNVLNGRGNVSLEKILLVENAAKQLGYSINERGQQLRKEMNSAIGVVLPNIRDERYSIMYSTVSSYLQSQGYSCPLYLTDDIPSKEEYALNEIASRRMQGVILVSCEPNRSEARDLLCKNGISIIFLERPVKSPAPYIGFDYDEVADRLIQKLAELAPNHVSIITGLLSHSNERKILDRVTEYLVGSAQLHSYQTDTVNALIAAFKCASDPTPSDTVVTTSPLFARKLMDAYAFRKDDNVPQIITLSPSGIIEDTPLFHCVYLDWKKIALHAAKMISGSIPPQTTTFHVAAASPAPKPDVHIPKKTKLNVMMLEGPDTNALRKLLPDFTHSTGIEVQFASFPYHELFSTIKDAGRSGMFDVLRMDVVWLSTFSKEYLQGYSLHDPNAAPILNSVLDEIKAPYSMIDDVIYSFPFTPNVQLQIYRKDIFDDPKVRRTFYEWSHYALEVPETFEQYRNLLRFFSQAENPLSPIEYGASIASGAISTMTGEFLPCFFGMGGKLFGDEGEALLDSEAGRQALHYYLDISRYMLPVSNSWWQGLVDHFRSGRTAMLNLFINHLSDINDLRKSKIAGQLGFGSVPGGRPLMGGGILGVAAASEKKEAALEFIRWACGERISLPFTLLGGISPCKSIYTNTELAELFPWLSVVPDNFRNAVMRRVPNGLDEHEVERVIGLAVKSALSKVISPEDALRHAQLQLERMRDHTRTSS